MVSTFREGDIGESEFVRVKFILVPVEFDFSQLQKMEHKYKTNA